MGLAVPLLNHTNKHQRTDMSHHRQAILNGDINKVVEILYSDSLSTKSYSCKSPSLSDRTDLVCCMCGKSVQVYDEWLSKASALDLNRLACSDKCREDLRDYRREGHWG